MARRSKQKEESIVKPLVKAEGEVHILEGLFETGEAPVMKAVGYMRISKGQNAWISYVVTLQGNKVLSIEVDDPNMRALAEESAKINFVNCFIDQELM